MFTIIARLEKGFHGGLLHSLLRDPQGEIGTKKRTDNERVSLRTT